MTPKTAVMSSSGRSSWNRSVMEHTKIRRGSFHLSGRLSAFSSSRKVSAPFTYSKPLNRLFMAEA